MRPNLEARPQAHRYGPRDVADARRLKQLEHENAKLKRNNQKSPVLAVLLAKPAPRKTA